MPCLLDNAGVGLFLISTPFNREEPFYRKELKRPFEQYRRAVAQHFTPHRSRPAAEFRSMYRPRPYALFGRFDLALISLVDDHDFSARVLRPFTHFAASGRKPYSEAYSYKVIVGPTPRFGREGDILTLAQDTFLDEDNWPLLGISQLKLNNTILVGTGATFLRAVITYIKTIGQALERHHDCRIVILESYSWHELTLLVFSRQYSAITDLLLRLRESSIRDVLKELPSSKATPLGRLLDDSSLLSSIFKRRSMNVRDQHVFVNTETALGFDFRLVANASHRIGSQISDKDSLELFSRWFIKPGHLKSVFENLSGSEPADALLSIGHGDLWFPVSPASNSVAGTTRTRDTLRSFMTQGAGRVLRNHVLRRYTLPAVTRALAELPGHVSRTHVNVVHKLNRLRFRVETLKQLRKDLQRLGVPKILSLKLLNVFTNFNDGILDRGLYASFVELRPFLESVVFTLRHYDGKALDATVQLTLVQISS